jgi:predicted aminopeptidase
MKLPMTTPPRRPAAPIRFVLWFAAIAAIASSCGGLESELRSIASKGKPIASMLENPPPDKRLAQALALVERVTAFVAAEYALVVDKPGFVYVESPHGALAWRVTASKRPSVTPTETKVFSAEAQALAFEKEVIDRGDQAYVDALDSIAAYTNAVSPLTPSILDSSYEDLIEWVVREILFAAVRATTEPGKLDGFAEFASEQIALAFLRDTLSPESPVISRYISTRRDARTFAALLPDYRSRFETLYANEKDPATREKTREMLSRAWLVDFRDRYPDRFLTNDWLLFAKDPWNDARLAAWNHPYPRWDEWQREFQSVAEKIPALLGKFLATKKE